MWGNLVIFSISFTEANLHRLAFWFLQTERWGSPWKEEGPHFRQFQGGLSRSGPINARYCYRGHFPHHLCFNAYIVCLSRYLLLRRILSLDGLHCGTNFFRTPKYRCRGHRCLCIEVISPPELLVLEHLVSPRVQSIEEVAVDGLSSWFPLP